MLWLPAEPVLIVGVLLVPCTDWFITFSQLGGGNVPRAIAVTPLKLLLQLLLLPLWLWLIAGTDGLPQLAAADLAPALAVVPALSRASARSLSTCDSNEANRSRVADGSSDSAMAAALGWKGFSAGSARARR